jgi:hypothetical protein
MSKLESFFLDVLGEARDLQSVGEGVMETDRERQQVTIS